MLSGQELDLLCILNWFWYIICGSSLYLNWVKQNSHSPAFYNCQWLFTIWDMLSAVMILVFQMNGRFLGRKIADSNLITIFLLATDCFDYARVCVHLPELQGFCYMHHRCFCCCLVHAATCVVAAQQNWCCRWGGPCVDAHIIATVKIITALDMLLEDLVLRQTVTTISESEGYHGSCHK